MTKKPHDQFAKQYLKGILSPFAQEVEVSFELPPGEIQQADVWVVPQEGRLLTELGALGKITLNPALIEVFRNPMPEDEIVSCFEKLCRVRSDWKRVAKREGKKVDRKGLPRLWLIVPTASEKSLQDCHALPKRGWEKGFFFLGETFRTAIIVVHQLPETPETLLLRLLGRGSVQLRASNELLELPEQPMKTFVLEKLSKLNVMLKSRRNTSKEDQELEQNIDAVYEEWHRRTRQEGHQEGRQEGRQEDVEGMLMVKFGTLDQEIRRVIPNLLDLSAIDRARAVMELSREELLVRFGR